MHGDEVLGSSLLVGPPCDCVKLHSHAAVSNSGTSLDASIREADAEATELGCWCRNISASFRLGVRF